MTESTPTDPGSALVPVACPGATLPEWPADAERSMAAACAGSATVRPAPLTIVMPPASAGRAPAVAVPELSPVRASAVDPATASTSVTIFRDLVFRLM
jgi:hypothetical protein